MASRTGCCRTAPWPARENASPGWARLPTCRRPGPRTDVLDARGALLTPGLIDCHTHLVFAGDRSREFEQRLQGASYEDIARAGGGILSTVKATRGASLDDLVAATTARARVLLAEGVTTIEIKSGYGLGLDDELKLLRAARRVGGALATDGARHLARGPRSAAGVHGPRRRVRVARHRADPAGRGGRGARRLGGCLLRTHRLHAGAGPSRVRARPRPGPSCPAARGTTVQLAGRCACGRFRRAVGGPPRVAGRGRRGSHGRGRHGGGAVAGRVLLPARDAAAARGIAPCPRRADRHRQRLQSRQLAAVVAAPRDEHGLRAVRPDARGIPPGCHPPCGPGTGTFRPGNHRARAARRPRAVGHAAAGRDSRRNSATCGRGSCSAAVSLRPDRLPRQCAPPAGPRAGRCARRCRGAG